LLLLKFPDVVKPILDMNLYPSKYGSGYSKLILMSLGLKNKVSFPELVENFCREHRIVNDDIAILYMYIKHYNIYKTFVDKSEMSEYRYSIAQCIIYININISRVDHGGMVAEYLKHGTVSYLDDSIFFLMDTYNSILSFHILMLRDTNQLSDKEIILVKTMFIEYAKTNKRAFKTYLIKIQRENINLYWDIMRNDSIRERLFRQILLIE
jgi:hypothetical protein